MSVQLLDREQVGLAAAFLASSRFSFPGYAYERRAKALAETYARSLAAWNIQSMKARYPEDEWLKEEEEAHLKACAVQARCRVDHFLTGALRLAPSVWQRLAQDLELIECNCSCADGFRQSREQRLMIEARRPLLSYLVRATKREEAA